MTKEQLEQVYKAGALGFIAWLVCQDRTAGDCGAPIALPTVDRLRQWEESEDMLRGMESLLPLLPV